MTNFFVLILLLPSLLLLLLVVNAAAAMSDNTTITELNSISRINNVIAEGVNECSKLQNDTCVTLMTTLDNICQIAYFPNCFGHQWNGFIRYLGQRIIDGDYPDEKFKDDPYLTLNNHHFGSSDWNFTKLNFTKLIE